MSSTDVQDTRQRFTERDLEKILHVEARFVKFATSGIFEGLFVLCKIETCYVEKFCYCQNLHCDIGQILYRLSNHFVTLVVAISRQKCWLDH